MTKHLDRYTPEHIEHIAKVAHAATQAHKGATETVVSWEDGREASIASVKRCISHPELDVEELHEKWVDDEKAAGKTHSHMVEHKDLPIHHQTRNRLFYDVVASLAYQD